MSYHCENCVSMIKVWKNSLIFHIILCKVGYIHRYIAIINAQEVQRNCVTVLQTRCRTSIKITQTLKEIHVIWSEKSGCLRSFLIKKGVSERARYRRLQQRNA